MATPEQKFRNNVSDPTKLWVQGLQDAREITYLRQQLEEETRLKNKWMAQANYLQKVLNLKENEMNGKPEAKPTSSTDVDSMEI